MEANSSVDRLQNTLNILHEVFLVLERAKQDLSHRKQLVTEALASHLPSCTEGEAQELASRVYWWSKEMKGVVGPAWKIAFGKGFQPTPARARYVCSWCRKPYWGLAGYWEHTRSLSKCCPSCEERGRVHSLASKQEANESGRRRQERIRELRQMPYGEYLRSQEWQETRRWMLERALFRCQLCNAQGLLDVHHRTYERRGEEWEEDLFVLCRPCHEKFHDKLPHPNEDATKWW